MEKVLLGKLCQDHEKAPAKSIHLFEPDGWLYSCGYDFS